MCTFSCSDPNPCPDGTCSLDVHFFMLLDSNRDGVIDVDDAVAVLTQAAIINNWEWGKTKPGAIILCNNDDDDSAKKLDNADNRINGTNDKDEIAPLVITRVGKDKAPASMKGRLEVSTADAARVRIFEKRSTGATEVIGPSTGNKYNLPDLNFDSKEFGIEALTYAKKGFDGLVKIKFFVEHSSGNYDQEGVVRVAPWIMSNHLDKAEKVYVVNAGSANSRFRSELSTLVSAAGCSLVEHSSNDIWMQDCMEFGFANLPKDNVIRTVCRATRNRPLRSYAKTLVEPDIGYSEPAPLFASWPNDNSFNSTGNLEVTPPVTSKTGKKYPFGRIYYGGIARGRTGFPSERFDVGVEEFLQKQIVQEPISVDTTWLAVGHVDEIISFVPAASGFKMLMASPNLAFDILNKNKKKHGTDKLLVGRSFPVIDPATGSAIGSNAVEVTIKKFLDVGISSMSLSAAALLGFNSRIQTRLDAIKLQFETEIGIDKSKDILDVPILFMPNQDDPNTADAMTAGMVNMLVINKHCIVPKPFGPVVGGKDLFEKDLTDKLTPLGLSVHFLDDWFEYHVNLGEVHCGTNTLRKPTKVEWWEFIP